MALVAGMKGPPRLPTPDQPYAEATLRRVVPPLTKYAEVVLQLVPEWESIPDAEGYYPIHRFPEPDLFLSTFEAQDPNGNIVFHLVKDFPNDSDLSPSIFNSKNKQGVMVLHHLCEFPITDWVPICEGADLNVPNPTSNGRTPFLHSVSFPENKWDRVFLKTLKSFGANLKAQDAQGKTALHIAVESGNSQTIKFFLRSHEFDILAVDKNGNSALDIVLQKIIFGHCKIDRDVVDNFIACGAKADPTLLIRWKNFAAAQSGPRDWYLREILPLPSQENMLFNKPSPLEVDDDEEMLETDQSDDSESNDGESDDDESDDSESNDDNNAMIEI
jgi:hypothetical protein